MEILMIEGNPFWVEWTYKACGGLVQPARKTIW